MKHHSEHHSPGATDEPGKLRLEPGATLILDESIEALKIHVAWMTKVYGIICDLDICLYFYDERARFIERLDSSNRKSRDGCATLFTDLDNTAAANNGIFAETAKVDLSRVHENTSAILVYLHGGPRKFQVVHSVDMDCLTTQSDLNSNSLAVRDSKAASFLFTTSMKTRKDFEGLIIGAFYKIGWYPEAQVKWEAKSLLEPVYDSVRKSLDEKCALLVVNTVPSLEKFRPHLFNSVREICSALSSVALPRLKIKFQKSMMGLTIDPFTEVLFKQLYETHPKVADTDEAAYTVAMIQEMFYQIDVNGDHTTSWDEFTTFCIQNGMVVHPGSFGGESTGEREASGNSLDEYVVEYGEDILGRDRLLSPHRTISLMRYVPENKRIMVIQDGSDTVMMIDDSFRLKSQVIISKIQVIGSLSGGGEKVEVVNQASGVLAAKVIIYDIIYLTGRDLYAYTTSDHTIMIFKEQTSLGGKKISYIQYNKFYHSLLHLKLCWSQRQNILCSVASDRVIYGWDIDKQQSLFQVSRHSDIITDFICMDNLEVFITCSMDKRIVLWSSSTRRVKGILLGHTRGVRSLSAYETTLLSAGFECEALTWDLISKENVAILKGHRSPIVSAKLMCERAESEKEYRAITVDEVGEFRLWNIFVMERSSEPTVVPTIQIFEMQNPESPLNQYRFIALPHNPLYSTSYYSNLITCSTKLMHFLPQKNAKEFVPPQCCVFNEPGASIMTGSGRNLLKYDITTGDFICAFSDTSKVADLTALFLDGIRARRIFIGCSNGDMLLVNCMSGEIIDTLTGATGSKAITSIVGYQSQRNNIYISTSDGKLHWVEENGGALHVLNSNECVFDDGVGISSLKLIRSMKLLAICSTANSWGFWHEVSLKKLIVIHESDVVTAIELLGSSRDPEEKEFLKTSGRPSKQGQVKSENLVTVAIGLQDKIKIYTIDVTDMRGICSYQLESDRPFYSIDIKLMNFPQVDSVNYSKSKNSNPIFFGKQIVAATDDGMILMWNINETRWKCESFFRKTFFNVPVVKRTYASSSNLGGGMDMNGDQDNNDDDGDGSFELKSNLGSGMMISPPTSPKSRPLSIDTALANNSSAFPFITELGGDNLSSPKRRMAMELSSPYATSPSSPKLNAPTSSNEKGHFIAEFDSSQFGPPINSSISILKPSQSWQGHFDSITNIISMDEHGCFITISHDGYHRLWNPETICLGEMPLPNLTEVLKNPKPKVTETDGWKFIMERLAVSQSHIDIAHKLIDTLTNRRYGANLRSSRNQRRNANLLDKSVVRDISTPNLSFQDSLMETFSDEQSRFRASLIRSLDDNIGDAEDLPPDRVATKEERKLAFMAQQLEQLSFGKKGLGDLYGEGSLENSISLFTTAGKSSMGASHLPQIRSSVCTPGTPGKMDASQVSNPQSRLGQSRSMSSLKRNGKSIWTISDDLLEADEAKASAVPAAFSELSLAASMREGLIDGEGYRMLRKVGHRADKVSAYDRLEPAMLLRNPNLSVTFQMPPIENLQRSEVEFGDQKSMYKNAQKLLNSKRNLTVSQMRNAIATARIEHKLCKVKSMIHVIPFHNNDDAILSTQMVKDDDDGAEKLRSDEQKMRLRLMQSAALVPYEASLKARPLDQAFVEARLNKVKLAMESGSEVNKYQKKGKKKQKFLLSTAAKEALEKKVAKAIRDEYKMRHQPPPTASDDPADSKKTLTTRALLPFYKLEDVKKFMDIFHKVDEDFSGDLDVNEWTKLFSSLNNQNVSTLDARMIFMKVDTNGDGFVSIGDLVPIVFSKATQEQMKLIIIYTEAEINRKHQDINTVTSGELEQLFDTYDIGNVGFVGIALLKDRVRFMQLPDVIQFSFMSSIVDMADDEMVSLVEFLRIFRPFIQDRKQ